MCEPLGPWKVGVANVIFGVSVFFTLSLLSSDSAGDCACEKFWAGVGGLAGDCCCGGFDMNWFPGSGVGGFVEACLAFWIASNIR